MSPIVLPNDRGRHHLVSLRPNRRATAWLVAAVAIFGGGTASGAVVLTSATFSESVTGGGTSGGGTSLFEPESVDINGEAAGGFASGHAAATGGAHPSIVLDLAVSASTRISGRVDIEYKVAVVPLPGAPVLDSVPVHMSAFGDVGIRTSGNYNGFMNAFVFAALDGENGGASVGLTGSRSDEDHFNVNVMLLFEPDVTTTVRMGAQGEVRPPPFPFVASGEGEAHAVIDPVFNIDPTFAQREFFQLVFSPGILPAPVPIPSAFWLMTSTIGLLFTKTGLRINQPHLAAGAT